MVGQESIRKQVLSRKIFSLSGIVKVGLLSAIAFVLMLLEFPMPIFPAFLKMDISDLPALIGGFYIYTNSLRELFLPHYKGILPIISVVTLSYADTGKAQFFIQVLSYGVGYPDLQGHTSDF
jgi:riboflavin transporter FmnP